MFVVYSMSSFLAPAANYLVDFQASEGGGRYVPPFESSSQIYTPNFNTETELQNEYADEDAVDREVERDITDLTDNTIRNVVTQLDTEDEVFGQLDKEGLEENEREDEVVGGDDNGNEDNEVDDGDLEGEHNQGDEQVVENDGDLGEEDNQRDKENVEDDEDLGGENNQRDEQNVEYDGDLGGENNEGGEQTVEEDVVLGGRDEEGVRENDVDDVERIEMNEDTVEDGTTTQHVKINCTAVGKYPFFLHSNVEHECMQAVKDNIGCSLDCG
ncbi:hypothetical protein RND81_09G104000 [Saponaria officinalis]|uniref:Uncharacterized protein n=1 Tax=Saponaria officinalis TaxID=3572 RepID=A0AAW1IJX9_SAPOF